MLTWQTESSNSNLILTNGAKNLISVACLHVNHTVMYSVAVKHFFAF